MFIEDIILQELKTQSYELHSLNEAQIPLNPFLAKVLLSKENLSLLAPIKAKAQGFREKVRSTVGAGRGKDDDTSYKLTPEQLEVMREILDKYGEEIIDDIMKFRKEILAPYQLIKKLIKRNRTVSTKEKFGMTHSEYKQAYENGLKKIENRKNFKEVGHEDINERFEKDKKALKALRETRKNFEKTGDIPDSHIEKILKYYDLDSSTFKNYSLEDLKTTYDELKRNMKSVEQDDYDPDEVKSLIKRNIDLRSGVAKKEREEKEKKKEKINEETLPSEIEKVFYTNNQFNDEFARYLLRRERIKQIKNKNNDLFQKIYFKVLKELEVKLINQMENITNKKRKSLQSLEFNHLERQIFRPKLNKYSGDLKDYDILIKDEDFKDGVEYISKPESVVEAEKEIQKEVKRFERSLKSKIDEKDFNKLKELRVINNLITIKELKDPSTLFKSKDQIKAKIED